MVDLLGIISFFLLSLVVRKLVVGYLKDTNAGEWVLYLDLVEGAERRGGFDDTAGVVCHERAHLN